MRTHLRAFALADLAAVVVLLVAAGVVAVLVGLSPQPNGPAPLTLANLRLIGQGTAMYTGDHTNHLPMTLTYSRGTAPSPGVSLEGWCNWSFGGKNNNAFWAGRAFDCEGADRPLNHYVIPDEGFFAPPSPQRLAANDPARIHAAAPMFSDPADAATRQRNWPQATPGITCYGDVGTSYLFNVAWWSQLSSIPSFEARFNEGTRRISQGIGVQPSRFVWLTDQYGDIIVNQFTRNFRITNGLGDTNFAPMLFLDGHVGYSRITATITNTPAYAFRFDP